MLSDNMRSPRIWWLSGNRTARRRGKKKCRGNRTTAHSRVHLPMRPRWLKPLLTDGVAWNTLKSIHRYGPTYQTLLKAHFAPHGALSQAMPGANNRQDAAYIANGTMHRDAADLNAPHRLTQTGERNRFGLSACAPRRGAIRHCEPAQRADRFLAGRPLAPIPPAAHNRGAGDESRDHAALRCP